MTGLTECQIFLTRECNLRCGYCRLAQKTLPGRELGLEEWKDAYLTLERVGIRTVKLLGGEPTVKPWLPQLIRFAGTTGIKTALLSNSLFNDSMLDELVEAGLWGYFASVDSISDLEMEKTHETRKAGAGYRMLQHLKSYGVPLLGANVVISKANLTEIPDIVHRLSDERFYVNICMVQQSDDARREFSLPANQKYRFYEENRPELQVLSETLRGLKAKGALITVPDEYLRGIPLYGIDCDWQCRGISQLRIDADGGLMMCNEYRTRLADEFNIRDLTPGRYERFLDEWRQERELVGCGGCYWSCFVQAEANLLVGRLEFDYVKRR